MMQEHRILVLPLKKYFEKEGKNNPIMDFKIKGGKIDLINYNKKDKVFDIAECKLANNSVKIGQTFGQVLVYYAIIEDNGRRFFKGVLKQARHWLSFEEEEKIFVKKEAKIRLWVCLAQKGLGGKSGLLEILSKRIKEKVGILVVDNGNVEVRENADPITVPIRMRYNKAEFYEKLQEDIKDKYPKTRFKRNGRYPNTSKFIFVHPHIHFEVWIRRRKKHYTTTEIEIGFHIECDPRRGRLIFKELKKREKRIKNRLPNVEFGRWGRKVEWYRLYERHSYIGDINRIDEKTLKIIEKKLLNYIKTLNPILEEINWGRRRKIN